jgi:hypothetical protein
MGADVVKDLRGIAIAAGIMVAVAGSAYVFTALVGPGPSAGSMSGIR